MKTHANNPFNLEVWPIEYVNYVKSSLKWEALVEEHNDLGQKAFEMQLDRVNMLYRKYADTISSDKLCEENLSDNNVVPSTENMTVKIADK